MQFQQQPPPYSYYQLPSHNLNYINSQCFQPPSTPILEQLQKQIDYLNSVLSWSRNFLAFFLYNVFLINIFRWQYDIIIWHVITTLKIPSLILNSPLEDKKYFELFKTDLNNDDEEKYNTFYKSTTETFKHDRNVFINNILSWLIEVVMENIKTTKENSLVQHSSFSNLKTTLNSFKGKYHLSFILLGI